MTPHQFMREIQFQPDDPNLNALGSYSAQTDKIVFYTFDNQRLSPEKDYASQYRNNNPAARYVVALHEAVHKVQAKNAAYLMSATRRQMLHALTFSLKI